MKAVLTDAPFSDPGWIFERKLDGVRCLAHRDGGPVRLLSRTDRDMTGQFPELADALNAQDRRDFVVDGEVVAFADGITSFQRLQRRGKERVSVFLYVFDLLRLEGRDLRDLPLRERKALLRRSFTFDGPLRLSPHRNEHGEKLFREACRQGLEGLIAKRADSPYRSAARSRDWLKLKCHAEQELVIGGYTAPQGSRTDFGALLVGYWEKDRLRYAGKVGTGFDRATLESLGQELRKLERDTPPFADVHPIPRGTHWVEPELVAQIAFSEWTRGSERAARASARSLGRLRHPRYLGLRDDKPAREVVRERPS
jgi:bifunctional non-homologous end joining protein LigD